MLYNATFIVPHIIIMQYCCTVLAWIYGQSKCCRGVHVHACVHYMRRVVYYKTKV